MYNLNLFYMLSLIVVNNLLPEVMLPSPESSVGGDYQVTGQRAWIQEAIN